MNYGMILYVIGWVLNFEAAFMVPSCITALVYHERQGIALAVVAVLSLFVGLLIIRKEYVDVCKGRICDGGAVLDYFECGGCTSFCNLRCDSFVHRCTV